MATENLNDQQNNYSTVLDKLMILPQYLLPQHTLSNLIYRLTRCEQTWFKNAFIHFIINSYKVNMNDAKHADLDKYNSFNAFFTRELKESARPIEGNDSIVVSPCDGKISQIGQITDGQIIQAKGHRYSVASLLAGNEVLAGQFDQGQFSTIYLSPRDYHRIHMPLTGRLKSMTYIPGKLFSVSPRSTRAIPGLFALNERVVTVFETELGPMVLVLVGAIFVGSMETVWARQITPSYGKTVQKWQYTDKLAITIQKGDEMGRFNMGSTVVLLLPQQMGTFNTSWQADDLIKLGQAMN